MQESTRAVLTLGGLILLAFLIFWLIPNKTSLDTAQVNFKKTSEQVKLYVDKKARLVVEESKKNTPTIEETIQLQIQVSDLQKRLEFVEKNDLTKEVLELQEQVSNLVAENGQLKIYIANLERQAHSAAITDTGVATLLQAHFDAYEKYKTSVDIMLKSLDTEVGLLDKKIDNLATKERSVLTKQTIIKTYYCYPRRCCR
jgi:parvulin-like peptidyl-prolyl isomerase